MNLLKCILLGVSSPPGRRRTWGFNTKGLVGGCFIVHAQRVRLWQGICHPVVRRCVAMVDLEGGEFPTWPYFSLATILKISNPWPSRYPLTISHSYGRSPFEIDNPEGIIKLMGTYTRANYSISRNDKPRQPNPYIWVSLIGQNIATVHPQWIPLSKTSLKTAINGSRPPFSDTT